MSSREIMVHSRYERICHWLMALMVSLLLFSGFYEHFPVDLGKIHTMGRNVFYQTTGGFAVAGLFVVWMYYKIVTRAYKDILFRKRDIADLPGLLKYYLFIEKKPPVQGKYNAGQKLVYTSWFFVFILMIVTGILLYSANFGYILPIKVTIQKIRLYHYIGACYFLGTIPLHIYLSLIDDPAKLQAIFTGWIRK